MEAKRTLGGALAGALGAAVWVAQQPLDKRLFGTRHDDAELLGRLVVRDPPGSMVAGTAMHVANGAAFGAAYALARPFLPGPPLAAAVSAALAEHLATWPLTRLVDRVHPARHDLEPLWGNRRVFTQSAWRHLLFGLVLGEVERRLNPADEFEPPEVPVSSNGHGNLERAAVGAT